MKKPILTHIKSRALFILLFSLFGITAQAQQTLIQHKFHGHFTPGALFDTVFDANGNKYSLGEISANDTIRAIATGKPISRLITLPANGGTSPGGAHSANGPLYSSPYASGYFRLFLDPASGMVGPPGSSADSSLKVLCQVLTDISNFVPSPCTTTGQTVNIWIRAGLTTGLGVATPFFNIPRSLTATGIADNTVWETLNSGVDAFTNIAPPLTTSGGGTTGTTGGATVYFHGSIAFNFGGAVAWHTNLHTAPVSGEEDLYTVALHEMMHVMGFCTLIDYDGRSVFDMYNIPPAPTNYQYYSRYDMRLQTASSVPLIIGSSSGCDLYQYSFNPAAGSTPYSVLSPGGCGSYWTGAETGNTVCGTAVNYLGGWGSPIPVYTPACFEKGGSLSHFDDQCYVPSGFCPLCSTTNCEYFVLSNEAPDPALGGYSATTNPGLMKRYLTPEERQVLCDIGYNVTTTFGNSVNLNNHSYGGVASPGLGVVGINDGISGGAYTYQGTAGTGAPISIPATALLSNDYGVGPSTAPVGSVTCVEVVSGSGTISPTSGGAGTIFQYTPSLTDDGIILLRYVPMSNTGARGNITYVYLYVGPVGCPATPCNLVTDPGFEGTNATFSGVSGWGGNVPCWSNYDNYSCEMHSRGVSGPYGIPSYWYSGTHPDPAGTTNDHFVGLGWIAPVDSTADYEVDAIQEAMPTPLIAGISYTITFWALVVNGTEPDNLTFAISNAPVNIPSIVTGLPIGLTDLAPGGGGFPLISDDSWHEYSFTVTPTVSGNELTILPSPWGAYPVGCPTAYFGILNAIDDITIVPTTSVCAFSLPDTICSTASPFNLNLYTCGIPGTFTWQTGAAPIVTNDSMFNPASALQASIALGFAGIVYVDYDDTDGLGCAVHNVGVMSIDTAIAPIVGNTAICAAGGVTTLSDTVMGGIWSSSNATIATVDSVTGVVTALSATGTTVITYALLNSCNTSSVTVGVMIGAPVASYSDTGTLTIGFTYAGTTTNLDSVVWNYGDGTSDTGLIRTHTYTSIGTYTVCATVYTACGNDTYCGPVTVSCVSAPVASFTDTGTYTIGFNYTGTTANLDSVVWNYGDGTSDTGLIRTHTYTSIGTYTVCATVYTDCGNDAYCGPLTVPCISAPVASFTDTGTHTVGFIYTGTATSLDSVVWSFGDGHSDTGLTALHTYAIADTYRACVTAYNPCGSDSVCGALSLGIESITATEYLNIFPNPAKDDLIIQWKGQLTGSADLVITDVIGREVFKSTVNINTATGQSQLNVGALNEGVYLVTIRSGNIFYNSKLLVQK